MPAEQWAWEFLRRNPRYHEDWHHYVETCASVYGFSPDEANEGVNFLLLTTAQWDSDPRLEVFVPAKDANESEEAWRQRNGQDACRISLDRWLGNKWGLTSIVDPSTDPGYVHFAPQPRFEYKVTKNGTRQDWGCHGMQAPPVDHLACAATVLFDLSIPIDPQIEYVRKELEFIRERLRRRGELEDVKSIRLRADKYRTYLRILDAYNSGIEEREIGETLMPEWAGDPSEYPREKLVGLQLEEAQRLVEGGYKAFLGKFFRKN